MSKEKIIAQLRNSRTKKKFNEGQIIHLRLGGSFARGEEKINSDIDLIYEKDSGLPRASRGIFNLYPYLEKKFNRKIELIKKDMIHPSITSSILSDAIQIW